MKLSLIIVDVVVEEIFVIITIGEKLEEEEIKFFSREIFTIFITPLGKPMSLHILLNKYAVKGVISDGFATTVLPAAIAGAIFQVNKYRGRFQGEIQPATPIGCLIV